MCVAVFSEEESSSSENWTTALKDAPLKDRIETFSAPVLDPRELHVEQIFSPNRFDVLTILKALNVRTCR